MGTQVKEPFTIPSKHEQKKASPWHIKVKQIETQDKERVLKAVRDKCQIAYEDKFIRIAADISIHTFKPNKGLEISFSSYKIK